MDTQPCSPSSGSIGYSRPSIRLGSAVLFCFFSYPHLHRSLLIGTRSFNDFADLPSPDSHAYFVPPVKPPPQQQSEMAQTNNVTKYETGTSEETNNENVSSTKDDSNKRKNITGTNLHFVPPETAISDDTFPPDPPFQGPYEAMPSSSLWAALCVFAKNELLYIDEWVDYHIGLGFDHVYIYDNDELNPMSDWVKRTNRTKNTQVIPFKNYSHPNGHYVQENYYTICAESLRKLSQPPRWVAFWDVDEFLVIPNYTKVTDFLQSHLHRGAIIINWVLFGTNNEKVYRPEPVTKRFTGRAMEDVNTKTIAVLDHLYYQSIHDPELYTAEQGCKDCDYLVRMGGRCDDDWWIYDGEKECIPHRTGPAYIYHYKFKSEAENKLRRCNQTRLPGWSNSCNLELFAGDEFDDTAWQTLKRNVPKYAEMYPGS